LVGSKSVLGFVLVEY
jgi:hypothetical protein